MKSSFGLVPQVDGSEEAGVRQPYSKSLGGSVVKLTEENKEEF